MKSKRLQRKIDQLTNTGKLMTTEDIARRLLNWETYHKMVINWLAWASVADLQRHVFSRIGFDCVPPGWVSLKYCGE